MAGGCAHPDRTARHRYLRVLGPVDAQKLPSSMTLLARRPLWSMFRDVLDQYFAGQEQPEVADRQCPHQVAAPPLCGATCGAATPVTTPPSCHRAVVPPGPAAAGLRVRGSRW